MNFHRGDMSVPAWALPQSPVPNKPHVSALSLSVGRINDLRSRANMESDWERASNLRSQSNPILIEVLGRGVSGDLPQGERVQFKPSDSDPNYSICVTVTTSDLSRTYYLKDKAAKTPAQQIIVGKARAIIRSRG